MAALMFFLTTSTDLEAKATIDEMYRANVEMFDRLLNVIAPEDIPKVSFSINSAMTGALTGMLAGRLTLEEAVSHVEWVARVLLDEDRPYPRKQVDVGTHRRRDR
jgi:hypothetical protein